MCMCVYVCIKMHYIDMHTHHTHIYTCIYIYIKYIYIYTHKLFFYINYFGYS